MSERQDSSSEAASMVVGTGMAWSFAATVRAVTVGGILVLLLLGQAGCTGVLTPRPTHTPTPASTYDSSFATPTLAPEVYLTPLPPTPTFTPSPTPTPVVHVVESGDTLFGVAIEYGVTLNGLLRVNGLSDQDYLSIGQVLVIPLDEEEAAGQTEDQIPLDNVILPTPTPLPLTIGGVARYTTPVGGLVCVGEVVNTSGGSVTNLQVEITLLASDGTPLLTTRTLAAADCLAPEARAPFSALIKNPPDGVADIQATLVRGESISAITAGFVPLTVSAVDGSVSGPQYRIRGIILNESAWPVSRISVVATLYSADGSVAGYRQLVMPADTVIPVGAEEAFDLLLTPQIVDPPADFSVIAWGING